MSPDTGPALDDAASSADLTPAEVVETFLDALAARDTDTARRLVHPDIEYANVSLPTVRGAAEFEKVLALAEKPWTGFEVYIHAISAEGDTVLTERTDALRVGRLRSQFWVWGRFDVVDGQIALWRDSFDWGDILRANLRGLAAMVIPSPGPTDADEPGPTTRTPRLADLTQHRARPRPGRFGVAEGPRNPEGSRGARRDRTT